MKHSCVKDWRAEVLSDVYWLVETVALHSKAAIPVVPLVTAVAVDVLVEMPLAVTVTVCAG